MNKVVLGVLGIIVGVFIIAAISIIAVAIGVNNTSIKFENRIKAQYEQNKNNYDKMYKTVLEMAQVPEMYKNDLKDVFSAAIQGRYGKGGSKAVFQFIKEHNPTFDSALYIKLEQTIQAGRIDFESNQKMLIDIKQSYDNFRMVFPNNFISGFLGFPKIKMEDYGIVLSEKTDKAFQTKKDEPLKLR